MPLIPRLLPLALIAFLASGVDGEARPRRHPAPVAAPVRPGPSAMVAAANPMAVDAGL